MLIMPMAAASLLLPIKNAVFSLTGVNDYKDAADHIAHLRVRKALVSVLVGLTKLGVTLGATYIALKPILDKSSYFNQKPSDVSDFKNHTHFNYACRVVQHQSFVKDSPIEKVHQFCALYFKNNPINDYHLVKDCMLPLFKTPSCAVKDWVIEDPIDAAYRMDYYVQNKGFKDLPPLKECTELNIAKDQTYAMQKRSCKMIKSLSDCEKNRISFLAHILKFSSLKEAQEYLLSPCLNFLSYDLCKAQVKELKERLSSEKEPS